MYQNIIIAMKYQIVITLSYIFPIYSNGVTLVSVNYYLYNKYL